MIFHSKCSSFRNYSFCLLLPLLESNLRFLYCSLNGLSDRLLTAISHEYYVTFTEILSFDSLSEEEIVKGTELNKVELKNQNKLYHFLPKPLMIQLLDMIIFPEGLRFRDRLSHGQIEFHSINSTIGKYVICSVISVLQITNSKMLPKFTLSSSFELISQTFTINYRCQYHTIYQLKHQLSIIFDLFLKLLGANIKNQQSNKEFLVSQLEFQKASINSKEYDLSSTFITQCDSIVLLLRNCAINYQRFLENIINFILIRSDEFDRCLLRSRQRSNFQTFQEKFPELINSLRNLFSYFEKWYQNLQFSTQQWNQDSSVFEKSMKHLLKIAENVAQLSSITKNRWDKIMTLFNDQDQLLKTTDTLFYENFI